MITAENEVFLDYNMKMGGRWGIFGGWDVYWVIVS